MTLLNYVHYSALLIIFIIFLAGVFVSFKQPTKKLIIPMLFSVTLISMLLAGFSIVVIDKYTKKVQLSKLKNKRLLSIEKIAYSGVVTNTGSHTIGEVTFELKLVNKAHVTGGNIKPGSFFSVSGFAEFFGGGADLLYKPQTITKKFIVARNLKAGTSKAFKVYFDYPPYFSSTSQFAKVYGH